MNFLRLVGIKWRRFQLFCRNRRRLRLWATGVADDLSQYDIEIFEGDRLSEALDQLEVRRAAQSMSDLFTEGPFQRRVVSTGDHYVER